MAAAKQGIAQAGSAAQQAIRQLNASAAQGLGKSAAQLRALVKKAAILKDEAQEAAQEVRGQLKLGSSKAIVAGGMAAKRAVSGAAGAARAAGKTLTATAKAAASAASSAASGAAHNASSTASKIAGTVSSAARGSVKAMSAAVTKLGGKLKGAVAKVKAKFQSGLSDTKGKMDQHAGKIKGEASKAPAATSGKISQGQAKVNAESQKEPKKEGGLWGAIKSAASWVAEKLKAAFEFVAKLLTDPGFWVSLVVGIAIAAFVVATFGGGLAVLAVAGVVAGAIAGAAGQIVSNVAAGRSWNEGVLQAAAFGAAGGLIFGPLGGRVAGAVGSRIASSAAGRVASTAAGRIASSAVGRTVSAAARSLSRGVTRLGGTKLGTMLRSGASKVGTKLSQGVRAIEEFGAKAGTYVRWGARKGMDKIRGVRPSSPARSTTPSATARSVRCARTTTSSSKLNDKERPKSYIDEDGNLVPCDPSGKTSPLQHINADKDAKAVSPWTSFSTRDSATRPKYYGSNEITLDAERLARDAARLPGVTILSPDEIQLTFRENISKIIDDAGVKFDVDDVLKLGPEKFDEAVAALGLSGKATSRVMRNLKGLYFNMRDGEWLVGGVIPKDYIIHQGHTLPGAVGAGATSGADRDER